MGIWDFSNMVVSMAMLVLPKLDGFCERENPILRNG